MDSYSRADRGYGVPPPPPPPAQISPPRRGDDSRERRRDASPDYYSSDAYYDQKALEGYRSKVPSIPPPGRERYGYDPKGPYSYDEYPTTRVDDWGTPPLPKPKPASQTAVPPNIAPTISQDHTLGREANEAKLFASLSSQHKSKVGETPSVIPRAEERLYEDRRVMIENRRDRSPGYIPPTSTYSYGYDRDIFPRPTERTRYREDISASGPPPPMPMPVAKTSTIKFKDAIGRQFTFPFDTCRTWNDMHDLIEQEFHFDEDLHRLVDEERFELRGPTDNIITPEEWSIVVQPGWRVTMHMLPDNKDIRTDGMVSAADADSTDAIETTSREDQAISQPSLQPPLPSLESIVEDANIALDNGDEARPSSSPDNSISSAHWPPGHRKRLSSHESSGQSTASTWETQGFQPSDHIKADPDSKKVGPEASSVSYKTSKTISLASKPELPLRMLYENGRPTLNDFTNSAPSLTPSPKPSERSPEASCFRSGTKPPSRVHFISSTQQVTPRVIKREGGESGPAGADIDHVERCSPMSKKNLKSVGQVKGPDTLTLHEAKVFQNNIIENQVDDSLTSSTSSNTELGRDEQGSYTDDLLLIDFDTNHYSESRSSTLSRSYESEILEDSSEIFGRAIGQSQYPSNRSMKGETDVGSDQHITIEKERANLEYLSAQIAELQRQNTALQSSLISPLPTRWVNMHRVECNGQAGTSIYLDVPVYTKDNNVRHLQGRVRVPEVEDYLYQHRDIAFIVYLDYECDGHHVGSSRSALRNSLQTQMKNTSRDGEIWMHSDQATHIEESVHITCTILSDGLRQIPRKDITLQPYLHFGDPRDRYDQSYLEIAAPYIFYYHFREEVDNTLLYLDDQESQQVQLLLNYIITRFDSEYAKAQALFSQGLVLPKYLEFLFVPQEVVVVGGAKCVIGYKQTSNPRKNLKEDIFPHFPSDESGAKTTTISFDAETWQFDGNFMIKSETIKVQVENWRGAAIRIDSLHAYPIKYSPPGLEEKLRMRGETFWACRKHNYITYNGMNFTNDSEFFNTRFMVDVATYWKIHHDRRPAPYADMLEGGIVNKLPPDGNFTLLLPANIYGFNMQEKKWMDLRLDFITPIDWNKKAFETLAVDDDTKELITALVSNKISADKGTDLMAGKGNGLIVLLHGGPGTGKTLTAESVAELAEKPLYRVTCGDLGIDPVKIEEYLDSVFHLGKVWDCVVLLDEADVFLEQRTLNDLSRNALVSVFLRALEYYDGILVLTSNRVGTFDEAFKSRIQLALHYESLNKSQRNKIWANFFNHLRDMNDNIDLEDLVGHISELSEFEMNGRQIRNALTTARQLALFKGVQMGFEHLKHVIKVSAKFDKYLFQLKAEASDDDWARDEGDSMN